VTGFEVSSWPFLIAATTIPVGWYLMKRSRVTLPFPDLSNVPRASAASRFWWVLPPALRSLALLLLAAALMNPIRLYEKSETRLEGIAIMLAVDISSSMLAEDFRPDNRIEVAKREVIRFAEARESDWLGLVAFAGEALTMVPGTLDHRALEAAVEALDPGDLRDGTAIGVALATAANRLRDLEPESRVVILLTDGDNNSGSISPEQAAAAAASLGIRVYTIGVGRDGVAPVPVARTAFGYQYANIRVRVNDDLLQGVAEATGGLYFRATDSEGLTRIYDRIDELETTPISEVRSEERVGMRRELVLAALGMVLLELLAMAFKSRRVWI